MMFAHSLRAALAAVATLIVVMRCPGAEPIDEARFEKEVLVSGVRDTVQLQVTAAGDIYFIERAGVLKKFTAATRATIVVGTLAVHLPTEGALAGLVLDPAFATNRRLYLFYGPAAAPATMRLSRFTLAADGLLDLASEKIVLTYAVGPKGHFGGGLQFDTAGDLWLGTGDNSEGMVFPETDQRPDRQNYDALRTSANTQDLRGKILRIHPNPDGTYAIPRGNLFADARAGRSEIYAMGARNPYRFFYDSSAATLYWADIGPNTDEKFGTGGFDEINRATAPGNFGWPLFSGPNAAYRRYDHATQTIGLAYAPAHPVNESRHNTGARDLPPAQPALIWYPSGPSREFPELGAGARAAMVGFVYHYDPALASPVKLPAALDGRLVIYDWCRNWIKTVALDANGGVAGISPFFPAVSLRRPIDLKLGPDGALYVVEYGEQWHDNEGVISRIVYRAGNRSPLAVATADVLAGATPLTVTFSAAGSSDPEGDALTYRWDFGDGPATASGRETRWTYRHPGVYPATLTVTDAHGLAQTTALSIAVGNAPPQVRIVRPVPGATFTWGETIPFEVAVTDAEDGTTADGKIPAARVQVQWEYFDRAPPPTGAAAREIGHTGPAGLARLSGCVSCHALASPSIGPSFTQIATRYHEDTGALDRLTAKVIAGGSGNWGEVAMPAHGNLSANDVTLIVRWILATETVTLLTGTHGEVTARPQPSTSATGVYVLTARYLDQGAPGVPPLLGETSVILRLRQP